MSGQGTKALEGNLARSHGRPGGSDSDSNNASLRSRAFAAARRVQDLSHARRNGFNLWRVDLGHSLPNYWELANNEHFKELVQRAHLDDGTINRSMAIPLPLISPRLTIKPPSDSVIRLGFLRGLDSISDTTERVERGMPLFMLVFTLSAVMLLINPSEYVGEIKGVLAVLVPLCLYWLSQRSKRRQREQAVQHQTADEILRFSADKEKRLEDRESKLRQEERDFFQNQMGLSRRRGHILARGYMAMEMANDQLIKLLIDNNIEIPALLLTQKTRAQVLGELKEVEDEQSASVNPGDRTNEVK